MKGMEHRASSPIRVLFGHASVLSRASTCFAQILALVDRVPTTREQLCSIGSWRGKLAVSKSSFHSQRRGRYATMY